MTNKEMYLAIVNGEINDEVIAKAQANLDSMEASAAKRAEKSTELKEANKALATEILAKLSDVPMTASDLADIFGVSPQKISSVLKNYKDSFAKVDVKVEKDGKNRKAVGYVAIA